MSSSAKKLLSDDHVIEKISAKMTKLTGVQLGDKQRAMVTTRLTRRVRELNLDSLEQYWSYLNENEDSELAPLTSLLTTHHTFFFREFVQFEHLLKQLPELCSELKKQGRKTIEIWCAACSTGQEVYSLATFFKTHLPSIDASIDFKIFASDVDSQSVAVAQKGVYKWAEVQKIPKAYLSGNWMKGTGKIADFAKVKKEITAHCSFATSNLLDFKKDIGSKKFDLIFCRNVFIYFTADQVSSISREFVKCLHPSGYVMTGLSEPLDEKATGLHHYGRCMYSKQPEKTAESTTTIEAMPEKKLRVICVDDSPTVHTLMKKILTSDTGFEIVGHAKNGVEAHDLASSTEFDLMALDIHMPEMNGLEYLKNHWTPSHPPVVMVSSVSVNDANLAVASLSAGATDYVEKPSLQSFKTCADEMRSKMKGAFYLSQANQATDNSLSSSYSKIPNIERPESKCRMIVCRIKEQKKIISILDQSESQQPPTILFLESPPNLFAAFADDLGQKTQFSIELYEDGQTQFEPGSVYVAHIEKYKEVQVQFRSYAAKDNTLLCLGDITKSVAEDIEKWNNGYLIVEDLGTYKSDGYDLLRDKAKCIVPYSSFAYESDRILSNVDEE